MIRTGAASSVISPAGEYVTSLGLRSFQEQQMLIGHFLVIRVQLKMPLVQVAIISFPIHIFQLKIFLSSHDKNTFSVCGGHQDELAIETIYTSSLC